MDVFLFVLNSVLLGVGLAMDAFSASLTGGLREPQMAKGRICLVAGVFAFFQYLMPVIGWALVRSAESVFSVVRKIIPWAALVLLLFIGIKMIVEGIKERKAAPEEVTVKRITFRELLVTGVATSIDALSVGLTVGEYDVVMANVSALIIGAVTFAICVAGVLIGRKAGVRLKWKAPILGGTILVLIGIEIFVKNMFFPGA